ncbi:MAG: hypothetical protein VX768_01410, partial [Planctomycetota bacterium]|nr:hypothetical protein [Planctomycetota bacterium]
PEKIRQSLKEEGITHLLINRSELERLQNTYGYNAGEKTISLEEIRLLEKSVLKRVDAWENQADNGGNLVLFECLPPLDRPSRR